MNSQPIRSDTLDVGTVFMDTLGKMRVVALDDEGNKITLRVFSRDELRYSPIPATEVYVSEVY